MHEFAADLAAERERGRPEDAGEDLAGAQQHVRCRQAVEGPIGAAERNGIDRAAGKASPMGSIERFAFYERARQAYCVIATGERRFYGCFVFQKGVIPPD